MELGKGQREEIIENTNVEANDIKQFAGQVLLTFVIPTSLRGGIFRFNRKTAWQKGKDSSEDLRMTSQIQ